MLSFTQNTEAVILENGLLSIRFDLQRGALSVTNAATGEPCLTDAFWRVDGWISLQFADPASETSPYFLEGRPHRVRNVWRDKYPFTRFEVSEAAVADELGEGRRCELRCVRQNAPTTLLGITLYEAQPFAVFDMGVDNRTPLPVRIRELHPLTGGRVFPASSARDSVRTLDGLAGAGRTLVRSEPLLQSSNNMLMTFRTNGQRRTFTAGGLTYTEFAKYVCVDYKDCKEQRGQAVVPPSAPFVADQEERFDLMAFDPHGRLVEAGEYFAPNDKFYIDFLTEDPFQSLERYAGSVRLAQHVRPNPSNFPIINGWYVGHKRFGSGIPINTSAGTIEEMDYVASSGFLKYSPAAIQLEPDKYHGNTEQGWWDDEHWHKHGHLKEPFETTAKWMTGLIERGGVPYIYFQAGLPSDDYAITFPEHMLFNDISKLHLPHNHHQPHVTFDYTDPAFSAHMLEVWGRLRENGLGGVKFDYPESAWRPEGGFEDKQATTASAYRRVFQLAREGLGPDAVINERALGESERPVVDVTLGLVDIQRVWTDASSFDPYMVTKAGLRWYKNRVLYYYDIEAKTFFARNEQTGELEPLPAYLRQSMLTMCYTVSAGLLLANSFRALTPEMVREITRMFPIHEEARLARPLDAFAGGEHPTLYDYPIDTDWHQVALFNPSSETDAIPLPLGAEPIDGGLGLDPNETYYLYSFWDDRLEGICRGGETYSASLRPCEARMLSVRRRLDRPQALSTNRHLMQGYVDMPVCQWDKESSVLRGESLVVGGETYTFKIAGNGRSLRFVGATAATAIVQASWTPLEEGLIEIRLDADRSDTVSWRLEF